MQTFILVFGFKNYIFFWKIIIIFVHNCSSQYHGNPYLHVFHFGLWLCYILQIILPFIFTLLNCLCSWKLVLVSILVKYKKKYLISHQLFYYMFDIFFPEHFAIFSTISCKCNILDCLFKASRYSRIKKNPWKVLCQKNIYIHLYISLWDPSNFNLFCWLWYYCNYCDDDNQCSSMFYGCSWRFCKSFRLGS